ncbi:MAG: calcium/sodium antiporter [candidate division WOR-3 bacterium]|nr:calcium/sodium antiporter [candidate division WOR-3 bacterium]
MIHFFLVILGFIMLILGADWLIKGAESIALKFSVPEIIVGFTIVSFGTSAPELLVGIFAALKGAPDITVGNVIGSNIFNLLPVLGISALIMPIASDMKALKRYVPFSVLILALLILMGQDYFIGQSGTIGIIDGGILLTLFGLYLFLNIKVWKKTEEVKSELAAFNPVLAIILLTAGIGLLAAGGEITTRNAVEIARIFRVSEKMIGLTVIATGTSLPELITSVMAVIKRKPDIAVGNVIGSNIFNILLILGVSSVISPLKFNPALNIDIIFLGIMSLLMLFAVISNRRKMLGRIAGTIMISAFVLYWTFVFIRN